MASGTIGSRDWDITLGINLPSFYDSLTCLWHDSQADFANIVIKYICQELQNFTLVFWQLQWKKPTSSQMFQVIDSVRFSLTWLHLTSPWIDHLVSHLVLWWTDLCYVIQEFGCEPILKVAKYWDWGRNIHQRNVTETSPEKR